MVIGEVVPRAQGPIPIATRSIARSPRHDCCKAGRRAFVVRGLWKGATSRGHPPHQESRTSDLTTAERKGHEDLIYATTLTAGQQGMPSFNDNLTDQQIADAIAHIRQLQGN